MSQYNDNIHTKVNNQDDHDAHPSLMHRIAHKLGIHSSHQKDDHKDSKVDKHSDMHGEPSNQSSHLHDNDPHRVHDKDTQPGVVHKMADKVGIHKDHDDSKTDHANRTEHLTAQVECSSAANDLPVGDMDAYPIYPASSLAPVDNDMHDLLTSHLDNKDSPGFEDKTNNKLGTTTDDNKSMDHHTKTEDAHVLGTTTNPHGHDQDNFGAVNSTNDSSGQASTSANAPSSTQHGYGHSNVGTQNPTSTNYTTTQAHTTGKEDSPSFKEKIKSKLGLSSNNPKEAEDTNLFGLPPSNSHSQSDVNAASRGFGAAQPLSHVEQTDDSSSALPRMTPQADGSVYSSSLLDNCQGSTMPGSDHNSQGYSTTTATGHIGHSYQN